MSSVLERLLRGGYYRGITLGVIYVMMYKKRKKKKKGSLEYPQNEKEDISKENIYLKERDMDYDIYLKGEDL